MKRDMDLVRETLLKVEAANEPNFADLLKEDATDQELEALTYNVGLLVDEGFLTGIEAHTLAQRNWMTLSLTWKGHEFLDTLRDPTVWERTKVIAAKAGGGGLQVLLDVGKAVIVEAAKGLLK